MELWHFFAPNIYVKPSHNGSKATRIIPFIFHTIMILLTSQIDKVYSGIKA